MERGKGRKCMRSITKAIKVKTTNEKKVLRKRKNDRRVTDGCIGVLNV